MNENVKKNIEDLIEGIDEFNNKYITYRAGTLRTILVDTLMYIEQKEQALDEIEKIANKREMFCEHCSNDDDFSCEDCGYCKILNIIKKVKENK